MLMVVMLVIVGRYLVRFQGMYRLIVRLVPALSLSPLSHKVNLLNTVRITNSFGLTVFYVIRTINVRLGV